MSKRKESYTLRAKGGHTLLNTPFRHVAEQIATTMFADLRSTYLVHNKDGKQSSVQHFIYGRPQK